VLNFRHAKGHTDGFLLETILRLLEVIGTFSRLSRFRLVRDRASALLLSFGTKVFADFSVNEKNGTMEVIFRPSFSWRSGGTMWAGGTMDSVLPTNNVSANACVSRHLSSSRPRLSPRAPFINVLCFSPISCSLFRPYHFCAGYYLAQRTVL